MEEQRTSFVSMWTWTCCLSWMTLGVAWFSQNNHALHGRHMVLDSHCQAMVLETEGEAQHYGLNVKCLPGSHVNTWLPASAAVWGGYVEPSGGEGSSRGRKFCGGGPGIASHPSLYSYFFHWPTPISSSGPKRCEEFCHLWWDSALGIMLSLSWWTVSLKTVTQNKPLLP